MRDLLDSHWVMSETSMKKHLDMEIVLGQVLVIGGHCAKYMGYA